MRSAGDYATNAHQSIIAELGGLGQTVRDVQPSANALELSDTIARRRKVYAYNARNGNPIGDELKMFCDELEGAIGSNDFAAAKSALLRAIDARIALERSKIADIKSGEVFRRASPQ
jgi:hypothetical protein